eukprot:CAMPEP_0116050358 /NCGR_PEP_ID=MMETSP0322-20121206/334_1 /TAXON_ID=163516 /ORGANISM="Leptocylindrus danicus var. apora, Strain B651" /LENGTH=588 /DNA_ID=CAMNT_0003532895 /DNA_START=30 /DNA_END=1796 /DNA_ORIENTATION=+
MNCYRKNTYVLSTLLLLASQISLVTLFLFLSSNEVLSLFVFTEAFAPVTYKSDVVTTSLASSKITKKQSAIYDGSEFVSILSFLKYVGVPVQDEDGNDVTFIPQTRSGYMNFVTFKEGNDRMLGVECKDCSDEDEDEIKLRKMSDGTYLYEESIVAIPNKAGFTDAAVISTAHAALCGVHVGAVSSRAGDEYSLMEKIVVLGGGEYACFVALALTALGSRVTLVTTRPMQLKDTPLNPLRESKVEAMSPVVGEEDQGFAEYLVEFDSVIDTLDDEAKFVNVKLIDEGVKRLVGEYGVGAKLKQAHQCQRYISTLTKSQEIVLKEGLLFARPPVLTYQSRIEKQVTLNDLVYLPYPPGFQNTLAKIFDKGLLLPVDRNENGANGRKKSFVRGCSFPDYAELEIWPKDTTDGAAVRYGFPGIKELTLEARVDEMMGSLQSKDKNDRRKSKSENPFVLDSYCIEDIQEEIIDKKRNAVVFVSASYCTTCRSITPQYTRMARISKEEKNSDLFFVKANTVGKGGKRLSKILGVESVPTFLLFKNGERYGDSFGITKLPSKKLDAIIENMESGSEWDPSLIMGEESKRRTRIQ